MVDQKMIAEIFNDFMALYLGKGTGSLGIKALYKKYDEHPMLLGLLSNLDEAVKIPVPQVMKETYQVYKEYRGRMIQDEEWQVLIDRTRDISEKWKNNKWCNRIIVELICLLDKDDKELRQSEKDIEKDMQASAQNEKAAA